VVAGTRLTNREYMKIAEVVGSQLVEAGFTVRQTVVLLSRWAMGDYPANSDIKFANLDVKIT
jgi:hypothetical protein